MGPARAGPKVLRNLNIIFVPVGTVQKFFEPFGLGLPVLILLP